MKHTKTNFLQLFILLFFMSIMSCKDKAPSSIEQPEPEEPQTKTQPKTLVIFFDGLRTDYITEALMPNLYAYKQKSVYNNKHYSVFPCVTRLNSTTFSTGSYPSTHGILGNTVYFPDINATTPFDTGSASNLRTIATATNDNLVTTTSMAEILASNGKDMMVFSSGSTGQALLQNHKVKGRGIINYDMIEPASLKTKVLSELPKGSKNKHVWVTDALLKYGLVKDGGPDVSTIWLSEPDGAAHDKGMGSNEAIAALKLVDEQFGRIITALKDRNLTEDFDVIISTDHGFVTYVGTKKIQAHLIEKKLKTSTTSTDVVVSGEAIYVKNSDPDKIQKIVTELQKETWIGAIFTKAKTPGDSKGWIAGTLSFDVVHWNHARSGDILVDRNWNNSKNAYGVEGGGFSSGGAAGHGGMSPYEMSIPLIVSGPSFKPKMTSNIPSCNVDLAPTILALQNITPPSYMDGRVMRELMVNQPAENMTLTEDIITTNVTTSGNKYELSLYVSKYGKYNYVKYSEVKR